VDKEIDQNAAVVASNSGCVMLLTTDLSAAPCNGSQLSFRQLHRGSEMEAALVISAGFLFC